MTTQRMTPMQPQSARPTQVRGLTGDSRRITTPGATAQLIDADWNVPGTFLVTGNASEVGVPTWTLRTGLDRAMLAQFELATAEFSQVVIARSISLAVKLPDNIGPMPDGLVQAVAVPISIDFSSIEFVNGLSMGFGAVNPVRQSFANINTYAVSIAAIELEPGGQDGVTVMNVSPAGRTLYLAAGDQDASIIAPPRFIIPIAAGGYWESPAWMTPTPRLTGIWDGADVNGYAQVTSFA